MTPIGHWILLALALSGCDERVRRPTGCPAGSSGCPCSEEGSCDPGLVCEDGLCGGVAAECGDGVLGGTEACDDGNDDDEDACTTACERARCGDGFVEAGVETCDDGNTVGGDDCGPSCGRGVQVLWTRVHDEGFGIDVGRGIDATEAGDVLVAGSVTSETGYTDVWVRAYDADGEELWTAVEAPSEGDDRGEGIASEDQLGLGAFVAGTAWGESTTDVWLGGFDEGALWLATSSDGKAGGNDAGHAVAVDSEGNVLVAGSLLSVLPADTDALVRKTTAVGEEVWTRTYAGLAGLDDDAHGVAVDSEGNVVVVGAVWENAGRMTDAWIAKYDADGAELWSDTFDGSESTFDAAYGVAVDDAGNVLVAGTTDESPPSTGCATADVWIRKYDPEGTELWTRIVDGPQGANDGARGVAVDSAGNVVVAGEIDYGPRADGIDSRLWVRKYDPEGAEIWTDTFDTEGVRDYAYGVAVDGEGNVVVVGSVWGDDYDIWVRKYAP